LRSMYEYWDKHIEQAKKHNSQIEHEK